MNYDMENIKKIIKSGYILTIIICIVFNSCISGDIPINIEITDDIAEEIDSDGDGITDDTENEPINVGFDPDLYNNDPSVAVGQRNNGSLQFGFNLRNSGNNYEHYLGTDDPNTDDWGTAKLIYVLQYAARYLYHEGDSWYNMTQYSGSDFTGPIQIGDMSLEFGGPWYPDHATHQNGLDADLRYVRTDRASSPLNLNSIYYDQNATHNVMLAFAEVYEDDINVIYVDFDQLGFDVEVNNVSIFTDDDHHDDHFHVGINCPSGQCL